MAWEICKGIIMFLGCCVLFAIALEILPNLLKGLGKVVIGIIIVSIFIRIYPKINGYLFILFIMLIIFSIFIMLMIIIINKLHISSKKNEMLNLFKDYKTYPSIKYSDFWIYLESKNKKIYEKEKRYYERREKIIDEWEERYPRIIK